MEVEIRSEIIDFSEQKQKLFENETACETESRRELGIFFDRKLRSK